MKLIKIQPDIEKAKSLIKLAELREQKIKVLQEDIYSSLLTETYYEICKELITALLFCDGYKTLSHKDLIGYIKQTNKFSEKEIYQIDDLRIKRNKLVYYGIFTNKSFLERNKKDYKLIISKLKIILQERIN